MRCECACVIVSLCVCVSGPTCMKLYKVLLVCYNVIRLCKNSRGVSSIRLYEVVTTSRELHKDPWIRYNI